MTPPGDLGQPRLWQRLRRWWQDRQADPHAGEGQDSSDCLDEQGDGPAQGDAGEGGNGNGGGD